MNSMFTTRIRSDSDESKSILGFLFNHVQNPYYQCRLQWRKNHVAVWRQPTYPGTPILDYWPHTREGHRGTTQPTSVYRCPTVNW